MQDKENSPAQHVVKNRTAPCICATAFNYIVYALHMHPNDSLHRLWPGVLNPLCFTKITTHLSLNLTISILYGLINLKGVAHRNRPDMIRSDKIYSPWCFNVMYVHTPGSYQIRHCKTQPDISKLEKFRIFVWS